MGAKGSKGTTDPRLLDPLRYGLYEFGDPETITAVAQVSRQWRSELKDTRRKTMCTDFSNDLIRASSAAEVLRCLHNMQRLVLNHDWNLLGDFGGGRPPLTSMDIAVRFVLYRRGAPPPEGRHVLTSGQGRFAKTPWRTVSDVHIPDTSATNLDDFSDLLFQDRQQACFAVEVRFLTAEVPLGQSAYRFQFTPPGFLKGAIVRRGLGGGPWVNVRRRVFFHLSFETPCSRLVAPTTQWSEFGPRGTSHRNPITLDDDDDDEEEGDVLQKALFENSPEFMAVKPAAAAQVLHGYDAFLAAQWPRPTIAEFKAKGPIRTARARRWADGVWASESSQA